MTVSARTGAGDGGIDGIRRVFDKMVLVPAKSPSDAIAMRNRDIGDETISRSGPMRIGGGQFEVSFAFSGGGIGRSDIRAAARRGNLGNRIRWRDSPCRARVRTFRRAPTLTGANASGAILLGSEMVTAGD